MPLKLVRKKKVKSASGSTKLTIMEKFEKSIAEQIRLANGEAVKAGRGVLKTWIQDGAAYDCKAVLVPVIGKAPLYGKSAIQIDDSKKKPGVAELTELLEQVQNGKMRNRVYTAIRASKKTKK